MADEPDNLVLSQLRELRALVETRYEALEMSMVDLRAEMRETRTALTGVSYFVNFHIGDFKSEMARVQDEIGGVKLELRRINERLDQRERA